jgi:poly-gamma-glutamate synthesis protein (capsule biosynthesis protein)
MIDNFVDNLNRSGASLLAVTGDVILDAPDPDYWLHGIASVLRAADVAIGHLEVPHTDRGEEMRGDVPAPAASPSAIGALSRAGFSAMSLAGNHIADQGAIGIADTIDALVQSDLLFSGAGANEQCARRPALIECNGRTVALLSYNCVGPEAGWATADRAGCAYLKMECENGEPVSPTSGIVRVTDEAEAVLREDIALAKKQSDLVIVALHKGIVHTPALLAPYEQPVAHAAIDAGADVVVGHHAHILKGIEIYRGHPIFHGLGNGCVVTNALSPGQEHPDREAWVRRRKQLFGFEPDPAYTLAPFHPEAVNAIVACLVWREDGSVLPGIVPVHVEAPGLPRLADSHHDAEVAAYMEKITVLAGLPPIKFQRDGSVWMIQ